MKNGYTFNDEKYVPGNLYHPLKFNSHSGHCPNDFLLLLSIDMNANLGEQTAKFANLRSLNGRGIATDARYGGEFTRDECDGELAFCGKLGEAFKKAGLIL